MERVHGIAAIAMMGVSCVSVLGEYSVADDDGSGGGGTASAPASTQAAGGSAQVPLTNCQHSSDGCWCRYDPENAFAFDCTPASVDGYCCAEPGYPAAGLRCWCSAVACAPSADGCECWVDTFDADDPSSCNGGTGCCADAQGPTMCECHGDPCLAWQTSVPSCTPDTYVCDPSLQKVSSCSLSE